MGLAQPGATGGALDAGLWFLAVASVLIAVGNLVPRGSNDGRRALLAWQRRDRPVRDWIDFAPARQAPPPAAEAPAPEPTNGFRWPFRVALLLVAAIPVALGELQLLAPLVVVFGWALLTGAHREKI